MYVNDTTVQMAGEQKPAVTREEYEQAKAVLTALPPGIYLHCSGCGAWKINGSITMTNEGGGATRYLCEGCA